MAARSKRGASPVVPTLADAEVGVGERAPEPGRTRPTKQLDVFSNPNPEHDYLIELQVPEFTCLCPLTGQPDFAVITITYVPDRQCVELKSLKLYTWSFRDEGAFHEAVSNRILADLVRACSPRFMRLTARWGVRGGIYTNVVVEHRKRGWKPHPPVVLTPAQPMFPSS